MNLVNQFTSFMAIVGVSGAIAVTGYPQTAMAQTTLNHLMTPEFEVAQVMLSELDQVYVQEAAQAGMAEVELAKLALEKSENENVRKYAQQIIQDYTPLNQELMQLAQQKRITPPKNVGFKYEALKEQLAKLSGANFDQAYRNEAGINGNMESLVMHTRQLQLGQDPDLQAFAVRNLPIVETHLQLLDELLM